MSAITLETAMLLRDAVRQYLNAMLAGDRSAYTVRGAKSALKTLVAFLGGGCRDHRGGHPRCTATLPRSALLARDGQRHTAHRAQPERAVGTSACLLPVAQDWLVSDPSKRIPNPRKPQQLPKAILDEAEVEHILGQPDLRTARGYRDRVILEVLYSSGIRREEAAHL